MGAWNIDEGWVLPKLGAEISPYTSNGHPTENPIDGETERYNQLWMACAGPQINVPRVGDKVYYFPQGHIEQVEAYTNQDGDSNMPVYRIPFKILCKVSYIKLKTEPNSDEVFAQITLLPEEEPEEANSSTPPQENGANYFCKRLTSSDASTHGGLSIPRRCAEDFFPPLDLSQEPPTQELVAKDLHGLEWRFRHVYRGQPKRHLLTSGWSTFVSTKKLVAGDSFIFIRGDNQELYIGIRRATKPQSTGAASVLSSLSMRHGILATAFHAISTRSMFTVYYRPWACPAEFLIAYDKYMKSTEFDYSVGRRFRMQLESKECLEHKSQEFEGTIIGFEDLDSIRWPCSEWRNLKVRWDATQGMLVHPKRVSPWTIEPNGILKMCTSDSPHPKRPRPFHTSNPMLRFMVNDGLLNSPVQYTSQRHSGVLQGPESIALGASPTIGNLRNTETISSLPVPKAAAENKDQREAPRVQPNGKSKLMLFGVDLFSSCLSGVTSPQVVTSLSEPSSLCSVPPMVPQSSISETIHIPGPSKSTFGNLQEKQCNCWSVTNRSCTKVLKYGTALGRSIDLACFCSYKELTYELDQMFDFKGLLIDGSSGWHVTYTDGEGDMLLLGDCPWQEFKAMVRKIIIYPKEEVDKVDLNRSI